MTAVVYPEPIDPQALRFAVVTELTAYRPLLAHLDVEGLLVLRDRLREPALVATCADGNLAEMRADTLDVVCRYLVAQEYAPAMYFIGTGEMSPETPDVYDPDAPQQVFGPAVGVVIDEPHEGRALWPEGEPDDSSEPDDGSVET
jgi:hypothetical protein